MRGIAPLQSSVGQVSSYVPGKETSEQGTLRNAFRTLQRRERERETCRGGRPLSPTCRGLRFSESRERTWQKCIANGIGGSARIAGSYRGS